MGLGKWDDTHEDDDVLSEFDLWKKVNAINRLRENPFPVLFIPLGRS